MRDISLHLSFVQIRKIAILLILLRVLAVCNYKTLNRSDRLFYPLIFYGTTRLYKLPNRSDGLFYPLILNGLFTCCASYQIGQIDLFSCTCRLVCYAKHRIGQMTLEGSFIISKVLSTDHKHGLHNTKVSADVWSICLIDLICRHHSNSYFKAIGGWGSIGTMIRL